jgi:phage-related protein
MFEVITYKDHQGKDVIIEYLSELAQKAKNSKSERVRLKKIYEYLDQLGHYGTRIGEPKVKHITGQIWELRPTNDRIFFFYWKDNIFVLLHHFVKKSPKTPSRELEQAQRNLRDFLERSGN